MKFELEIREKMTGWACISQSFSGSRKRKIPIESNDVEWGVPGEKKNETNEMQLLGNYHQFDIIWFGLELPLNTNFAFEY